MQDWESWVDIYKEKVFMEGGWFIWLIYCGVCVE